MRLTRIKMMRLTRIKMMRLTRIKMMRLNRIEMMILNRIKMQIKMMRLTRIKMIYLWCVVHTISYIKPGFGSWIIGFIHKFKYRQSRCKVINFYKT